MRRWHGPRYLTDPEIQNLFVGTCRNGDNSRYFRIGPDGKHQKYAVKRAAAKLGLGHETLSRLLQEAQASGLILVGKFDNGKRKPIPRIKKEKIEKPPRGNVNPQDLLVSSSQMSTTPDSVVQGTCTAPKAIREPKSVAPKPPRPPKAVREPKPLEEPKPSRHPRYFLVARGEWWGIFDAQIGNVSIVSRERYDAMAELQKQLRSERKEPFLKRSKVLKEIIYA
jgi:hypothetical protein